MQELHFDVAQFQRIARIHPDEVRFGYFRDFLDTVGFVFVSVNFYRIGFHQLGYPFHIVAAETAADMVRVIVGRQRGGQRVVLFRQVLQD